MGECGGVRGGGGGDSTVGAVAMERTMTPQELAKVVAEMRHSQMEYFRTRSTSALAEAKRLERKVDHCCEMILDDQGRLFEE